MDKVKRKATTVYLHPKIARAAKVKAALRGESVSDLVNDALARGLQEDEADLRIIRERKKEKARDFEEVLREMKQDGLL